MGQSPPWFAHHNRCRSVEGAGRRPECQSNGLKATKGRGLVLQLFIPTRTPKSNALLTATEGFEPSASGNLPSGQQGVCGYWRRNPVCSV